VILRARVQYRSTRSRAFLNPNIIGYREITVAIASGIGMSILSETEAPSCLGTELNAEGAVSSPPAWQQSLLCDAVSPRNDVAGTRRRGPLIPTQPPK
jgi:hypothetical protein